jgi:steroid delta-isomerase-like uncharacterized protein
MSDASATRGLTDVERLNLDAVFGVHDYWNRHDLEGVLAFYDDEITWVNVALEETYSGKDEVRAFLGGLFAALPDLTFSADYALARGDEVAERWSVRGTHRGSFMGVPATGRSIEITGISLLTMREGKFLRDEFYSDGGAVLRQLGLMPPLRVMQSRLGRMLAWITVKARPSSWRAARR